MKMIRNPFLMARFQLSNEQAEAILELRLRHLAKLEEMKLRKERDALDGEREEIEKTFGVEASHPTPNSPGDFSRTPSDSVILDARLSHSVPLPRHSMRLLCCHRRTLRWCCRREAGRARPKVMKLIRVRSATNRAIASRPQAEGGAIRSSCFWTPPDARTHSQRTRYLPRVGRENLCRVVSSPRMERHSKAS